MATVTLDTLWLNDHANLSDYRSFPFMKSLERTRTIEGSRRKYGTGRLRSFSKAGQTNDWNVTIVAQTQADITWLQDHIDKTMLARDDRGHSIFAVYYSVPVTEHAYNKEGDVTLSLIEVTATVEV